MMRIDRLYLVKVVNRIYLALDNLAPKLREVSGIESENPFEVYKYAVTGVDRSGHTVLVFLDDYSRLHVVRRELEELGLHVARSFAIKTGHESRLGLTRLSISNVLRMASPRLYTRMMYETFSHVLFELHVPAYLDMCSVGGHECPIMITDLANANVRVVARATGWRLMREYVTRNRIRERMILGQPLPEAFLVERRSPKQRIAVPEGEDQNELEVVFRGD